MQCPALTFTDDLVAPAATPCNASLLAFVIPMASIALLRVLASFIIWQGWLKRYTPSRTRLPVFPALASVTALCCTLIAGLGPTQVLTTKGVVFLLCVMHFIMYFSALLTLRYYLKITKRMMRFVDNDDLAAKVSRADLVLKIMFRITETLCLGLLVSSVLTLALDGPPWFQIIYLLSGTAGLNASYSQAYQQ